MRIDYSKYIGATIVNIRQNRFYANVRTANRLMADLVTADGEILMSADLEYITKALYDRLPKAYAKETN